MAERSHVFLPLKFYINTTIYFLLHLFSFHYLWNMAYILLYYLILLTKEHSTHIPRNMKTLSLYQKCT